MNRSRFEGVKNPGRFVLAFFILSVGLCALFPGDSRAAIREANAEPEAREWLKTPASADFFDQSRGLFLTRYEAERLVLKLYDAGALKIGVIFLMGDPEGFRIALPLDVPRRRAIFEIVRKALQRQGAAACCDAGQDEFIFWIRSDSYE